MVLAVEPILMALPPSVPKCFAMRENTMLLLSGLAAVELAGVAETLDLSQLVSLSIAGRRERNADSELQRPERKADSR